MQRIPPALRQALRYAGLTAAVSVTAAVIWTLGPGAGWVLRHVDGVRGLKGKELADALDAVRGRALAVATGLAALVAVYYTARNADTARRTLRHSVESARRTAELTEQGQVTERYTKAIEQLGSEKRDVRLGGIYALERIAADSSRDHPTVMEVLAAFIRGHASVDPETRTPYAEQGTPGNYQEPKPPDADIQAALTVIARRNVSQDTRAIDLKLANLLSADLAGANLSGASLFGAGLSHGELGNSNLSGASLYGADLGRASLSHTNLVRATLSGSYLIDANLEHADLTGADVSGAYLTRAYLYRAILAGALVINADLTGADLTGANLTNVHLAGADLTGANLTNVHLAGADLTGAKLADADLTGARYTVSTKWPEGFAPPGSGA